MNPDTVFHYIIYQTLRHGGCTMKFTDHYTHEINTDLRPLESVSNHSMHRIPHVSWIFLTKSHPAGTFF